jgi:hypothetical protein
MMDDTLRKAKLAKLIEIEGYDSFEELAEAVFSDAVSPATGLHERRVRLHLRDGAQPGRRLLRGMPHQHDDSGLLEIYYSYRCHNLDIRAPAGRPPLHSFGLNDLLLGDNSDPG